MKLPASFRPPQHYPPSFREFFKDFPTSSYGLLTKLLTLDPAYRGTAAMALQSEEKITEASNTNSQEAPDSTSSSSFISIRPTMHEKARHATLSAALSPVKRSSLKNKNQSSPRTEGHPNASKNTQNYTLLQASITDIINPNKASGMPRYRPSISTIDFHYLDPKETSRLFGLENKE